MNAETSAWGRALIAVGAADAKRHIASANEVRNRTTTPATNTAPDDEGRAATPSGDFADRAEKIQLRKRIRSEQPNHSAVVDGTLNYMELPELKEIAGPVRGALV